MTLQQLLGINLPLLQAPMAGVQGSALAVAVCEAGGLGAHDVTHPGAQLRRTQAGPFVLDQAVSLETLEKAHAEGGPEALGAFLLPADAGLLHWPLVQLSEHSAYYWLHGQPVRVPEAPKFGMLRVQDHEGRFIGIGEVTDDGRIAPRRLIRSV